MIAMITVKIFGVVRLQTGASRFETDVQTVDELLDHIPGLTRKEAKDLIVMVNGKSVARRHKLRDGDEVALLSPAGGG